MKAYWSKPHYGVSHLGRLGDNRWATIEYHLDGSASMTRNGVGIGLADPNDTHEFASGEQARAAGEAWVNSGTIPPELVRP